MPHGFGIIGCGMIAGFHARAIADIRGAKLVACFDTYAPSAERLAEKFGCRPYTDLSAMLADPAITVVTIGTPSGAHMEPAVAAAEAGKHVIVENRWKSPSSAAIESSKLVPATGFSCRRSSRRGFTNRAWRFARQSTVAVLGE